MTAARNSSKLIAKGALSEPTGGLTELLSFENATHRVRCRHAVGNNGRTYYQLCHILKKLPDGRLKLQVYGDRFWLNTSDVVRVRYVDASRVFER